MTEHAMKDPPNELSGNSFRSAKVTAAGGIQWVGGMDFPTHIAARCTDAACVPEGPSRNRWCAWDLRGGGLKEVDLVGRVVVDCAGEEGEEY